MTTVQIALPDQLAKDAEQAGLLSPEMLGSLLREQLRTRDIDRLFSAMDRMAAVADPAFLSPEEVAAEIATMRAERRASATE